jgi:hypothetical protein
MRLAGRRREMEQIGRLLDRAGAGAGGLLVLVGPAGSGKTTMAEAAADQARRLEFDVLRPRPRRVSRGAWCGRSCCAIRTRLRAWPPTSWAAARGRWGSTARPVTWSADLPG